MLDQLRRNHGAAAEEAAHEEARQYAAAVDEITYTKWLSDLRAGLAETLGGVLLRGVRPAVVGVTGVGASLTRLLSTSAGRLAGWSFRESTNASWVVVELFDVAKIADVSPDLLVATFTVPPGLSREAVWPGAGISLQNGLVAVLTPQPTANGTGLVYLGGAD